MTPNSNVRQPTGWPRAATPCDLKPRWAGEFRDFNDWVNFASARLSGCEGSVGQDVPAICVDAKGRRCHVGKDFHRARDEDAFPVRYFWECDPGDPQPAVAAGFQVEVDSWMDACFGAAIKADQLERGDRFIEEALELVQTMSGFSAERAHALVDYVFSRPVGEPFQEVGGVMVTLAALCNAADLDIHAAAATELARVWTKVETIRAKQATKPKGSALPVAPNNALPADVQRLVIAARIVAFEDQSAEALRELDQASEAFADRVPWEDEPEGASS